LHRKYFLEGVTKEFLPDQEKRYPRETRRAEEVERMMKWLLLLSLCSVAWAMEPLVEPFDCIG